MGRAGGSSGAYVRDGETGRRLFAWNSASPRILASNTKLFTVGAALARRGVDGTIRTSVLSRATIDADGVLDGSLYLRGAGDPTFGSKGFVRSEGGGIAT